MGYTTRFEGHFTLDKPLAFEHAAVLQKLNMDTEQEDFSEVCNLPVPRRGYFQWRPTKDRLGIEWDAGEKFYYYDEWLQWLVDGLLAPWGYKLSGQVRYQGEERSDNGLLKIVERNGKSVVVKEDAPEIEWAKCPRDSRLYVIDILRCSIVGDHHIPSLHAAMRLLEETK